MKHQQEHAEGHEVHEISAMDVIQVDTKRDLDNSTNVRRSGGAWEYEKIGKELGLGNVGFEGQ